MQASTQPLSLHKTLAAEIMTPAPVSIRAHHSLLEAAQVIQEHHLTALPVVDLNGHPQGVISQTDLVRHLREKAGYQDALPELTLDPELETEFLRTGKYQLESADLIRISDVMTPVVHQVGLKTPIREIIGKMLKFHIHHIFVIDEQEKLCGVVSGLDILRALE